MKILDNLSFPPISGPWFSMLDSYPFLIVCAAFVLSLAVGILFGPVLSSPLPLWWRIMDALFSRIGRKLDRPSRPAHDLILRGLGLSVVACSLAYVIGLKVDRLGAQAGLHFDVNAVFFSFLLTSSAPLFIVNRLRSNLPNTGKKDLLTPLSHAMQTDFSKADSFAVTRSAVSLCILTFERGLIAPVFWFLVGGLPMACATSALSVIAWRFGGRGKDSPFILMPLWLDSFVHFIPGYLCAFLLLVATLFTPTASTLRALQGLFTRTDCCNFLPERSRSLSVVAWALNVSLGGPVRTEDGENRGAPWIGPKEATARLDPGHIGRILYLSAVAHLIFLVALLQIGYRPFSGE